MTSVATFTFQFNVTAINDAPTAVNDVRSTPEDTPANFNLKTNDTDPDGDVLTHSGFSQPLNGIVTVSGAFLRYSPNLNYCGPDSFGYTVADPSGAVSNTGTVSITVTCVNDAPVVVDDTGSLVQ